MIERNFYDLPKCISAWVRAEKIMLDETAELLGAENGWVPCDIFGLSLYEGEVITAMIRLVDGSVFTYIPFHFLSLSEELGEDERSLREVHFMNAPDMDIRISRMQELANQLVSGYNVEAGEWMNNGQYHFTVDWVNDNVCISLVSFEGRFMWLPFHKMKFGKNVGYALKGFKKQRETWVV